jgi:cell division protein FtsB
MIKKYNYQYIFYVLIIIILTFNKGNRDLIRRFFEQNKLRKSIITICNQNSYLKKTIFFLQNDSYYLERAIRIELNMIAPEEIEYRFNLKK